MHIRPMSKQELASITTPQQVQGGQTQAYPLTLYDQAEVANGDAEARFFATNRVGRFRTNLETPGALPSGKYFAIHSIHVTVLSAYESAADPDTMADVVALTSSGNAVLTLTIQDKTYGPWPIHQAQALGGPTGFGFNLAAVAATAREYANNGIPGNGGLDLGGAIWLTPNAGFEATLQWGGGVTLNASRFVEVAMKGGMYRAVV